MFIKNFFLIIFILTLFSFAPVLHAENYDHYPERVDVYGYLNHNVLTLSWSKSSDSDFKRYHIIQSTSDRFPQYSSDSAIWSTDDINENRHTLYSLDDNQIYSFRVCVNNTFNRSTCSRVIHLNQYGILRNFSIYIDVNNDAWYYPYIVDLREKSVLPLYDMTFEPDAPITRAEFAEWLGKAMDTDENVSKNSDYFCDIHVNRYIDYLGSLDIMNSYYGGDCASRRIFKPAQHLTRAEALQTLFKAFDVDFDISGHNYAEDSNNSNIAVDVNQNQWFAPYVYRAQKDNIVDTDDMGYFNPFDSLTRANAAKIISRAIKEYQ